MDEMNNVNEAVETVAKVAKTRFNGRQVGTLSLVMSCVAVTAIAVWEGGKAAVKGVKSFVKAKKELKAAEAENIEVVE